MYLIRLSVVAAAVVAALVPGRAEACGGFFCSSFPVDQAQENILFHQGEDGGLEVHVQISYQGSAESFAWILPFPRAPMEMDVGSDSAMTLLSRSTMPQFRLVQDGGFCETAGGGDDDSAEGNFQDASNPASGGDGGVTIVDEQEVGPYNAVVLDATDAEALTTWLGDNGYDIPAETLDNIAHYVDQDFVFVALKLLKDRSAGDILPFVARFSEGEPCIPLILTAIAAVQDMPVVAFFLGGERFVPENFYHVRLNLARLDWMTGGNLYRALATEALSEAPGGRAYLTEFAGSPAPFAGVVWSEERFGAAQLATASTPIDFMNRLVSLQLPPTPLVLSILSELMPMPPEAAAMGLTPAVYYGCLICYQQFPPTMFDAAALAAAFDERVFQPMKRVQDLVDGSAYMTRLITLISPENMTVDPEFVQNPDVGDVPNVQTARFEYICEGGWPFPVRLTLPDGTKFVIDPDDNGSYSTSELAEMPAALVVEQMSDRGEGVIVTDNRDAVRNWQEDHAESARSGCGCRVARGTAAAGGFGGALLALVGMVVVRRRKS